MNIAIIGCGASGLVCASLLKDNGFKINIFEKNNLIGGVWSYSKEGVIYDSLVTNLPKTIMQFSDKYKFKGKTDNSFVSYKEVFNYLEGKCSLEKAIENIKTNSRRYAKRQLTWFNANKNIVWHEGEFNTDKIIESVHRTITQQSI